MFNELIKKIIQLKTVKSRVVIAISGFGGAGKSYLANQLRDYFKLKDTQIIRIDHLYRHPEGPGILGQTDWNLVRKILQNVHLGKPLKYQGMGFRGESILIDEALPEIVIIEGIRLLQPELMSSFDISIWIDCPQEFALQRAKARDREQGEDEATIKRWDTDWGPKDKEYFEKYRPDKLATFIYRGCPKTKKTKDWYG